MSDPLDFNGEVDEVPPGLAFLPTELVYQIIEGLDLKAIQNLCSTNARFRNICADKYWARNAVRNGYVESVEDFERSLKFSGQNRLVHYKSFSPENLYFRIMNVVSGAIPYDPPRTTPEERQKVLQQISEKVKISLIMSVLGTLMYFFKVSIHDNLKLSWYF